MRLGTTSFASALWSIIFACLLVGQVAAKPVGPKEPAQVDDWSRLITAESLDALERRAPEVQLVDIRPKKYVKKGTVPGAIWLPFKSLRGPKERPGQPPEAEALAELLGQVGLDLNRPIVIFNQSGSTLSMGRAAYVYWLLKSAGAEQTAILNGGFKSWTKAGFTVAEIPNFLKPRHVVVTYRYDWWADPMDIVGVVSGQQEGVILDARLDAHAKKARETGKHMSSMPMAQYVPASLFTRYLTKRQTSAEGLREFRAGLMSRGVKIGDDLVISVCQTGELSALSWFYASEVAGVENVLYYPDALQGWKSDGGAMFGLRLD